MLRYCISNPIDGIRVLQSAYEVKQDSQYKITEEIKPINVQNCIRLFCSNNSFEKNEHLINLENHLMKFTEELKINGYPSIQKPYPIDYSVDKNSGLFLYHLCKTRRPEIIIETGVAYGRSSAYILQALHENQKGRLYSIDYVFSPWQSKQSIGSAIPEHLRDRWEIIFGPTTKKLPKLLNSLDSIDIFFHDSLHTFKTMTFEFQTSWPYIKKGGFLLSDDATGNNAFHNFCHLQKLKPTYLTQGNNNFMGILQKTDEDNIPN